MYTVMYLIYIDAAEILVMARESSEYVLIKRSELGTIRSVLSSKYGEVAETILLTLCAL